MSRPVEPKGETGPGQTATFRTRHLHQIHPAGAGACRLGYPAAGARRVRNQQGPHHRTRQAGLARPAAARRYRAVRQAQYPDRGHRGQEQPAQPRRRHAAGAGLRRNPASGLFLQRRRLRVPRPQWPAPANDPKPVSAWTAEELWTRYRRWKGLDAWTISMTTAAARPRATTSSTPSTPRAADRILLFKELSVERPDWPTATCFRPDRHRRMPPRQCRCHLTRLSTRPGAKS